MMEIIKKNHRKIILTAPILFLMISADYIPKDNGVFLKPSTYFPEVGSRFSVNLEFSSNSPFNATDGLINYPGKSVSVEGIDVSNTSIDLWGATPEWSNGNGVMAWSGGIISPVMKNGKQSGNIFRAQMIPTQSVPINISIKEASMLASNGTADNIIENVGNIRIYPHPKGTPSPDIDSDKKITARDITQVMIGISKKYNPKLDINGDKTVNYKDVNQMIVYYNELNK